MQLNTFILLPVIGVEKRGILTSFLGRHAAPQTPKKLAQDLPQVFPASKRSNWLSGQPTSTEAAGLT